MSTEEIGSVGMNMMESMMVDGIAVQFVPDDLLAEFGDNLPPGVVPGPDPDQPITILMMMGRVPVALRNRHGLIPINSATLWQLTGLAHLVASVERLFMADDTPAPVRENWLRHLETSRKIVAGNRVPLVAEKMPEPPEDSPADDAAPDTDQRPGMYL